MNIALNKAEATELFEKEAILFGTNDIIPFYRAIELFGEEAIMFFDKNIGRNEYLRNGRDWNIRGEGDNERPMINYLYKAGFFKLVTEHNYQFAIKACGESEGARIFGKYREERGPQDRRDENRGQGKEA